MQTYKRSLFIIIFLIAVSGTALALIGTKGHSVLTSAQTGPPKTDGRVTLSAELVQDKVLTHSDGKAAMALNLSAAAVDEPKTQPPQPVDLVVVLDRSSSMGGQKIEDAKAAIRHLLSRLQPTDRFSLVTYSNGVQTISSLVFANNDHRRQLDTAVTQITANGSTHLSGGLQRGIDIFAQTPDAGRQRKIILISDGRANRGITDPLALGKMAAAGTEFNFGVSTVGVGYDFNEILMTTLADHGAGQYYFLEDPTAFARVFEKEFNTTRHVAATGVEIRIPLKDGVRLTEAGGFPVKSDGAFAVIHPGDLPAGQSRKIFLTFHVPTNKEGKFALGQIQLRYHHKGHPYTLSHDHGLAVACVSDEKDVMASIDEGEWTEQVLREDYNRLKGEVADAIRAGRKEEALTKIRSYEDRNRRLNHVIQSPAVTQNLDKDVKAIRADVEETFTGKPAEVAHKKKQQAKALQYESYQIRRDKK